MIALLRGVGALVAGVATFYFAGWFAAAILSTFLPAAVAAALAFLGSGTCGVVVFRRLWRSSAQLAKPGGPGVLADAVNGALIIGGLGFVAGFFGPLILTPESNQGPLLGIFVTGPLGVVAGAVGGYVLGLERRRKL